MKTFVLLLVVYADLFIAFLLKHTHPFYSMALLALATICLIMATFHQIKTAKENAQSNI